MECMRNADLWKPTKFETCRGHLRGSRNPLEVSPGSRLYSDIIAAFYETYLPSYARGRTVDLGCGKAPLAGLCRPLVSGYICVDWAGSIHGRGCLDLECDLSRELPFRDGSFDTVILSDVMEHIPEPGLLWSELYRILSPGGAVVMNTPFLYRLHEEPHDYYRYTEFALKRHASAAGFEILQFEPMGGSPEVLTDFLGKNLLRIPTVGCLLAGLLQSAVSLLGRMRFVRHISESTERAFPLGYFMVAGRP